MAPIVGMQYGRRACETRDVTAGQDRLDPAVSPFDVKRPVMIHRWERLTFLHWRFDADVVQRALPAGLRVETYDGAAWVGLVPFFIRVRPPHTPWIPWAGQFCETNVRTYVVDGEGRSGIWFFSLDAERFGAVLAARSTYRLPYFWSEMRIDEDGDRIEYTSLRRAPAPAGVASRVSVLRGEPFEPASLTLFDHFLTARWVVFSASGRRYGYALAWHPPWRLHRAVALEVDDHLVEAAGLPQPQDEPLVHYSPGVEVRVSRPHRTRPVGRDST